MKNDAFRYLFVVTTTLSFWSCLNSQDAGLVGPPQGPAGAFAYTSYDESGTPIVTGWLNINLTDPDSITGEWHLQKIGNPENIGPQVGAGIFIGGSYQNQLWVELNPEFADNNLQLVGTLRDQRLSGEWFWISFPGVTGQGTFEAVKK
jgi:hypothetical protein